MAHHSIGDVGDGHLGNWGFREGGMGAVSTAIERAARSHGAEIRTCARVARVIVEGDRATGVVLENGDEIRAQVVVTTLHPRTAFLDEEERASLTGLESATRALTIFLAAHPEFAPEAKQATATAFGSLGFADDLRGLAAGQRLALQAALAALLAMVLVSALAEPAAGK